MTYQVSAEEIVEIEAEFVTLLDKAATIADLVFLYEDFMPTQDLGLDERIFEKLSSLPSDFEELLRVCKNENAFDETPNNSIAQYFFDWAFALISTARQAYSFWECVELDSPKQESAFAKVLELGSDWNYFSDIFYGLTSNADSGLRHRNQFRSLFDRVDELGLSSEGDSIA